MQSAPGASSHITITFTNPSDREKLFSLIKKVGGETLPTEVDDDMPLLQELGMPTPDDKFNRIWYPGFLHHKSFSNYLVEYTGVLARLILDGAIRSPVEFVWDPEDGSEPTTMLNIWRIRVWERSTAIHVYGIYNPSSDQKAPLTRALGGTGWVTKIGGIEGANPNIRQQVAKTKIVAQGMLLLHTTIKSLHQRGDEMSVEVFHNIAFEALQVMVEKGIRRLSQKKLGAQLRFNEDTISKYLSREPGLYTQLQTEFKRLWLLK
jgi:hypothetical protein